MGVPEDPERAELPDSPWGDVAVGAWGRTHQTKPRALLLAHHKPIASGVSVERTSLEIDGALVQPTARDVREASPADPDDPCQFGHSGDRTYCGNVLFRAEPKSLYVCEGGRTVSTTPCPNGCTWPGVCVP